MRKESEKSLKSSDSSNLSFIMKVIKGIIISLLVIVIPVFIYEVYKLKITVDEYNSVPVIEEAPNIEDLEVYGENTLEWPKDRLFIEEKRTYYNSSELTLVIPKLDINDVVMDGTSQTDLKYGPGLYEMSQMPGEGDRNVSIAGHRTGYGRYYNIFKNIHKLEDGDLLYLYDKDHIYTYQYKETKIVEADDWSVILLQGYSSLTLTSCHPIGSNEERIVVVAELISIHDNIDGFNFVKSQ